MPNAKLLLELPGVEAGSRECGKCDLCMAGTYEWLCGKFRRHQEPTRLDNAEEAAKNLGLGRNK